MLSSASSSRSASPESPSSMQIFVKNLAGESRHPPSSQPPITNRFLSFPYDCARIRHDTKPHHPPLVANPPPGILSPPRLRGEASLEPEHPLGLQHHPRKHITPGIPIARRHATQEDPLYLQRLQGGRAAHHRRLRVLQWALLWEAPFARGPQMRWFRGRKCPHTTTPNQPRLCLELLN